MNTTNSKDYQHAAFAQGGDGPKLAAVTDDEQQEEGGSMLSPAQTPTTTTSSTFPFDRDLLKISDQERHWALHIKKAMKQLPDLDMPSDFMLVHMGIAGKGDVEWAIARAYKMQSLRKQYKILGTYEEGAKAIRALMDSLPGSLISFNYDPYTGKLILIMDSVNKMEDMMKDQKGTEILIRGAHYICHACFPSLECVRVGNIHVFEMEGYSWVRGMLFAKAFARFTNDSHGTFPSVMKEVRFYHIPPAANMIYAMINKFIPDEIADRHKVGCKFAGGRLDSFYLVPTKEEAYQRLYINLCGALKMRLESEKEFVLKSYS